MRRGRGWRRLGLTLIEIEMAMMLLLLGVLSTIEISPLLLKGQRLTETHTMASQFAQFIMETELSQTLAQQAYYINPTNADPAPTVVSDSAVTPISGWKNLIYYCGDCNSATFTSTNPNIDANLNPNPRLNNTSLLQIPNIPVNPTFKYNIVRISELNAFTTSANVKLIVMVAWPDQVSGNYSANNAEDYTSDHVFTLVATKSLSPVY
jgi:Tfp pilus assembly protein PilV